MNPLLEAAQKAILAAVIAVVAASTTCGIRPPPTTTPAPGAEVVPTPIPVPAPGPANAGLVQQSDLTYLGAFKLPQIDALQYAGTSLAYHHGPLGAVTGEARLLVQGQNNTFLDVVIPALGTGPYALLPEATIAERFPSLDNGLHLANNPADTSIRGTLFAGAKLILSVSSFYDAARAQTTSHLSRDLATGVVSTFALTPVGHTGGYMTLTTGELGPALTGNFGLPILDRESNGPAAFIFDPQDLTKPAVPVLDYDPLVHPIAAWNRQNPFWTSDSRFGGMAAVEGSLLFIGVHGVGPYCYGPPYDADYVQPPNDPACLTILHEDSDKGSHSDPYIYRIWAYDIRDLIKVKHGQVKPSEPMPYGLWTLDLPYSSGRHRAPAAVYDSATRRLFLLQQFGDKDPANGWPVVHVYQFNGA